MEVFLEGLMDVSIQTILSEWACDGWRELHGLQMAGSDNIGTGNIDACKSLMSIVQFIRSMVKAGGDL